METDASSKKALGESFSKKEVTFCDKSSILFYAVEEAVDSLNDSVIHTISNDNFPLLPEFSNMLQNSSTDSDSKYSSDLGNLPKAIVVLEKLPEALVHEHTCSDNVTECCLMANVPQNTHKVCSLKSGLSHHKKITEPVMNQISPILKKNEYPIRNLTVSIPQLPFKEIVSGSYTAVDSFSENTSGEASTLNMIANNVKTRSRNKSGRHLDQNLDSIQQSSLQNLFGKVPSSRETETSKFLSKNCMQGKENIKIVDSDTSTGIVSRVNGSEVSFDKYPCIHLEKLNLGPYLHDISSSSDYLQSKKDVPVDSELEVGSTMNISGLFMTEKTLPAIEEVSSNTVHFSPPVIDVEDDSTSSDAIFSEENDCTRSILKDLLTNNEVPSNDDGVLFDHKNSPKGVEDDSTSSDAIFSEENDCTRSILKDLLTNNEVPSNDDGVLFNHKNNPKDISFLQSERILEDTNLNNSIPYKNAQNKFPIVLLERMNLPFSESDINYDMDSTKFSCINSVPIVTNVPDLPIRIENVCSISTENFNKIHKRRKKSSKHSINTIQKHDLKDHFNESELSIIKPKSNHASSFNISESSSESMVAGNSSGLSSLKPKSNHASSFNISESSSESMVVGNSSGLSSFKPKSNHASLFNISESSSESMVAGNSSGLSSLKPKSNHASLFDISESSSESMIADNFISESDDSSSENDLPLIMLSKQKLNLSHSFNQSEESSSDDITLISPNSDASLSVPTKPKNSQAKSYKHKKKNSIHVSSGCSSAMKKKGSKSQMPCDISKKKCNKFVQHLPPKKKKNSKKSLRKKQMKVYKMITKYLEMQMKSEKRKKKSKKRKNSKSVNLVPSSNGSDTESTLSSDSVALINNSVEQDHSYAQNKNSFQKEGKTSVQCKKVCHGESSSALDKIREHSYAQTSKNSLKKKDKTSKEACHCVYCWPPSTQRKNSLKKKDKTSKEACHCVYCWPPSTPKKDTKAKKQQKSVDKYRLGFLSNKLSLRFYNRFLASERLLFSKCKLKKNKKKELKRLFTRLKAVGLMSLK